MAQNRARVLAARIQDRLPWTVTAGGLRIQFERVELRGHMCAIWFRAWRVVDNTPVAFDLPLAIVDPPDEWNEAAPFVRLVIGLIRSQNPDLG